MIRDFLVFEIRKNLDLRKIFVTPKIFLKSRFHCTTLHNLERYIFCDKHICQIILFMESYVPMPAWLLAPDSSLPKPTPLYLVIPTQPQSGHPSSIFNAIWTLAHGVLRQVTVHNRRRFWGGGKGTSKNGNESQIYILFCCWHFIQRFGKCRSLKFDHRISQYVL